MNTGTNYNQIAQMDNNNHCTNNNDTVAALPLPLVMQAANLNQDAIFLHLCGKTEEGIQILSNVINILKTYAIQNNRDNSVQGHDCSRQTTFDQVLLTEISPNGAAQRHDRHSQHGTIPIIFTNSNINRDMLPYTKAFLCVGDVPYNVSSVSAIVLYNIALFYHQQAEMTNREYYYCKAIEIYIHSIQSLKSIQDDGTTTMRGGGMPSSITLTTMFAAALHNLAHCHVAVFMDREYAAGCQKALEKVLNNLCHLLVCCESQFQEDLSFFYAALTLADHRDYVHRVAPAA